MMSEQTSQQHLKMIKCFLKSKSLLLLLYKVCFEKLEFLVENQIDLLVSKRKVKVLDKYYLEETPSLLSSNLSLNELQKPEEDENLCGKITELCHPDPQNLSFHT